MATTEEYDGASLHTLFHTTIPPSNSDTESDCPTPAMVHGRILTALQDTTPECGVTARPTGRMRGEAGMSAGPVGFGHRAGREIPQTGRIRRNTLRTFFQDDDDYVDYDDNDSVWAYVRVGDKFSYWMPRPVTRRTPTLMPTPSHSRDVDPDERHYRVSSAARNGGEYADADGETIAIQRGPTQHHHHAYTLLHHPFPDVNEDNNDGPDPHHRPLDSRLRSSRHRDAERVEILRTPWPRDAYNSWRHGYREGGSETDHPHTRRSDSIRTHSGDVNEGPVAILRVPVHSHRYRPNSQNYRDDRYDDDRSSFARNHSGTADEPRVQILRGPRTTHWHGGNDGDHNNRTHSGCVGEEPVAILRRPEPKWQSHGWRLLKPTPLRPILTPGFSPPHQ